MTLWHAYLDTRRFSFDAYGATESEAIGAMRGAINAHCRQYHCDAAALWADYADSVFTKEISAGAMFRDNEPLKP